LLRQHQNIKGNDSIVQDKTKHTQNTDKSTGLCELLLTVPIEIEDIAHGNIK